MFFNPLDNFYKDQIGSVKENTLVTFRLRCFCDNAIMVIFDEHGFIKRIQMEKEYDYFKCRVSLEVGLYWYYFDLCNGEFVGINKDYVGEITCTPVSFQLSVYSSEYETPAWLNGGIIYQIFPDRFCRGEVEKKVDSGKWLHENWRDVPFYMPDEKGEILNNDFFGGDIKGIISKLDYLKELGVSVIYLNPIFEAYSNHRYDTGNYLKIDSLLGSEEDFIELINKADEKGIKIILDGVFNHTGSDSIYFNKENKYDSVGAYQSRESKYFKWYDFINYPNEYKSWWGIKTLPATNKESDEFFNFICGENGVIEHYTKLGIGGWRLDVVDELPEKFSEGIRKAVKRINKDAIIIGEVWEDASNKISYGKRRKYFLGKELDSVMNYPLKNAIIDYCKRGKVDELAFVIKTQLDHYPKISLDILMNILATHDTFRLLSALLDVDVLNMNKCELANMKIDDSKIRTAIDRLKVAVLLQYTLYGVPCVYYGDEAGMLGFSDPLNRGTFPWNNINYEIFDFYKKMGKVREISAFIKGETKIIKAENGILSFVRSDEVSQVLVVVNLGNDEYSLNFGNGLYSLLDGKEYFNKITLKKGDYYILIKR